MEQWEIDLRAKLENEIEDGYYTIDCGNGFVVGTGKGGYINFEVEFVKQARGLQSQVEFTEKPENKSKYTTLNLEDFREALLKFYKKKDNDK